MGVSAHRRAPSFVLWEQGVASSNLAVPTEETLAGARIWREVRTKAHKIIALMSRGILRTQRRGAARTCVLCAVVAGAAGAFAATSSAAIQIRPTIGKPVIAPSSFVAAKSGPSVLAATGRAGAIVRFGAFNLASVTFTVQRALPGRRQGKRCVKPTVRSGKARRCTRYKAVGRFRYAQVVALGAVRFRFSGRVAGRRLKPGPYRLLGVPRSPTGVTGPAVFAAFGIA
jgi:hypothetical protein